MITITKKERFDDVGPKDSEGLHDYAYHGYNYDIAVGERVFRVRTYDDEPRVATVISPTGARELPEARQLVDFIVTALDCTAIKFYCGPDGTYRPVDVRTLEFIEV